MPISEKDVSEARQAWGEVADKSGIQFRLLNRSRGPAVRGPRTQSDRSLYKKYIQQKIVN